MIDKFKQAFLEEAREILVELETSMLALNENPGDAEIVGRVFRALHTIKGSGSMFGFDTLASFTHNLETAFDEVRNGRLKVTDELVNLSLAALDQIKAMLAEAGGGRPAQNSVSAEILGMLQKLTGLRDRHASRDSVPAPESTAQAAAPALKDWQVRFCPGPDFLLNGSDPLRLLSELRDLGKLQITASVAALPPLPELDPERCYILWDMVLSTAAPRDAIRDVFIFVEDRCELTIAPISDPVLQAAAALTNAPSEKRSGYGRRAYDRPDSASSVRVPAEKLDQFVNLVGELVTVQARLGEIATRSEDPDMAGVSEQVERLTSALRESSMSMRMLAIRPTFERFRRLVHDLARDLHKEVELTIEGAETELDKTVIEQLNDPLMHLVRNSMDHGIETPEQREAAGKSRTAVLRLSARHSGGSVLITVSDDGAGINAQAVRERAVEKDLVAADAQLTEEQIFQLILAAGFSTAKTVTDVSGRGVGMDVVRRNVDALRGTIEISSKYGEGTSVTLRLPLTLAIIDGLLVRVDTAYFVLPLAITVECIELTRQDIEKSNGKHISYVRGEIIPYIRLREYFDIRAARPEREQIMVVETEMGRYGFVVDQVIGNCQTVIKNLGRFYRHVHVASGATILGNGTVALILDPGRLVQEAIQALSLDSRIDGRVDGRLDRHGRRPGKGVASRVAGLPEASGEIAGSGEGARSIH